MSPNTSEGRLTSGDRTTLPTLRKNGWTNEKGRVGSPPLALLPLQCFDFPRNSQELKIYNSIEPTIKETLQSHGISYETCELVYRAPYGRLPGGPTVFIKAQAKGDYHDSWALAVEGIRLQLRDAELTQSRFRMQFRVEIMDPELEWPAFIADVESEHRLVQKWEILKRDVICPAIEASMQKSVYKDIHAIDLLRFGFDPDYEMNPPTIIIVITPGHSWSEWRAAEEEIDRKLPRCNVFDIRCVFLHYAPSRWRQMIDTLR
ncbi:hypothetical protein MMC10_006003 [Thelotrema lepadinum]|nr:hypothetical protein [Thelotrema lepadinum]